MFSANDEVARPRMLKLLPQRENVANAILGVKAQNMKNVLSNEMKCFLQMQKT